VRKKWQNLLLQARKDYNYAVDNDTVDTLAPLTKSVVQLGSRFVKYVQFIVTKRWQFEKFLAASPLTNECPYWTSIEK
jgi:hypothetical protein